MMVNNGWHIGGILSFFLFIIFWGFVIFGIYLFLKSLNSLTNKRKNSEEAMQILKTRYAKGEITKDEYKKMKQEILK